MTVASEITRIQCAKSDIRQAIIDKWVDVWASLTIDEYAACILAIPSKPKNWCIDLLVVGWWWEGWINMWWWWGWWGWGVVVCESLLLSSECSSYNICIWAWWTNYSNWWDSSFDEIVAYWGWRWGGKYQDNNIYYPNIWWSGGWWGSSINTSWCVWCDGQWNKGWNWTYKSGSGWQGWNLWWWWGWAWTAWCDASTGSNSWWNGWNWILNNFSWANCYYWGWWWWDWVWLNGVTGTPWCWWLWWWGNGWCNATFYGWGWWWNWWGWYQWVVILRYKTDGSSWICNTSTWWCKYICWDYTIHCFTTIWTTIFTPVYK